MTIPSLEDAYKTHLRPLMGAVGRLEAAGYRVPPSDAMDLIHDFFLERWPSITKNYREGEGDLFPYLYKSFVRFAKARLQEARQHQFVYLDDIDELPADEPPERHNHAVLAALARLPDKERYALRRFFVEGASQSALKRELEISRHKVPKLLARSLGLVLTYLERPEWMSEREWAVAFALWRERWTKQETASTFGLSRLQVEKSERRCLEYLTKGLRSAGPRRRSVRRVDMDAGEIFVRLLESKDDRELLERVRDNADEIIARLQEPEYAQRADEAFEKADEEWAVEVYSALAGDSRQAEVVARPAHEAEDREIGVAFAQLDEATRAEVPDLVELLGEVSPPSDEAVRALIKSPSVEAARQHDSHVETMVRRGITPLTVFYATEAIGGLFDRLLRYGDLSPKEDHGLFVRDGDFEVQAGSLTPEAIYEEIAAIAECDLNAARGLAIWITKVAMVTPYLISGFWAESETDGVMLVRDDDRHFETLDARWGWVLVPALEEPVLVTAGDALPAPEERVLVTADAGLPAPAQRVLKTAGARLSVDEAVLVRGVVGLSLGKFSQCIDTEMRDEREAERVYHALLCGAGIKHTYNVDPQRPDFVIGEQLIGVEVAGCYKAKQCKNVVDIMKDRADAFRDRYKKLLFLLHDAQGYFKDPDALEKMVDLGPDTMLWIVRAQHAEVSSMIVPTAKA